ncbi:uncharacterized protein LOC113373783 isoform X3 [Ctenocephalides felis]|uniref:uncharacterized protein LOC113373783 isoform X3 n=1 Tax=Ctenocephalides felis TaxID=7515 RepID=UPI000E6E4ECA|nr:uncharacterized protein LOC113373783 isoform X3 [Ctenocephalides felis]
MAGKVTSRKSKAKLDDAIALNGEAQETSESNESANQMITEKNESDNPDSNSVVEEASSSEEVISNSKNLKRKASESLEEAIDTNEVEVPSQDDKQVSDTEPLNDSSVDGHTRKSGRKVRPKKPKTAYDDESPAPKSATDKVVIKQEPEDEEMVPDTVDATRRPSSQMSIKSDDGTGTDSPAQNKAKSKTDLSNPLLREPMALGWKRELVFRATLDSKNRRQGDIYYYTPSGKKLRSTREIADHLSDGLTMENFSFAKEPIGLNDPSKEIIRDARNIKGRGSLSSRADSPTTPVAPPSSTSSIGKRTPKPKLPKGVSPPPTPAMKQEVVTPTPEPEPKVSPKKSPKSSFKVKLTNARLSSPASKTLGIKHAKSLKRKSLPATNEKPVKQSVEKSEKPKKLSTGKKASVKNTDVIVETKKKEVENRLDTLLVQSSTNPVKDQCSIQCLKAMGMIPTLQCQQCLCLYHYECIGIKKEDQLNSFKCMKCIEKAAEDTATVVTDNIHSTNKPAPPPLTPITSIKSHLPASDSPPKLQRIPRPGDKNLNPKLIADNKNVTTTDVPKSNNILQPSDKKFDDGHKSLLGSVTTWLPPSSSIQMSKSQTITETNPTACTQGIAHCAGKKYIVVPKHNVLSVFPAQIVDNGDMKITENALSGISITTVSSSNLNIPHQIKDPITNISKVVNSDNVPNPIPDNNIPSNLLNNNGNASVDDCGFSHTDNTSADENSSKKKVPHETGPSADPERSSNKAVSNSEDEQKSTDSDKQVTLSHAPFVQHFCLNVSAGYFALLKIFQYLKVQELLRASRVCRLWYEMSNSPSLWKTVRMKNSQVGDWHGFAKSLQKHQTKFLDLRKMLIPASVNPDDMWKQFSDNIGLADSLISIDFCRCPARIIEKLCETNPKMETINAVTIRDDKLDLAPFATLKNLHELRLKSSGGFEIQKDLSPLKDLKNLRHLSITSVKELGKYGCDTIAELVELQSLELGECNDFPEDFGSNVLNKLQKLERLRLEKGQGNCHTFSILECVSKLPSITQLELVNFDIKTGFDKSLALCKNIKRMLIIPTYITQSATTNHMVLSGVIKLSSSLTQFVWGVTLELLRVTELFVDQYENSKIKDKKPLAESIPVLKPVPSLLQQNEEKVEEGGNAAEAPQVEILTLQALQKLLNGSLPQTKVRILKIPFHASWRQSISDTQ